MKIQGAISILLAVIFLALLKNSPSSVGLQFDPLSEGKVGQNGDAKFTEIQSKVTWREVFQSPFLWILTLIIMIVFGTCIAVLSWAQLYLIQDKGQSQYVGSAFLTMFGTGATVGSIIPSYISDRCIAKMNAKESQKSETSPRISVMIVLSVITLASLHLFVFYVTPESSVAWISCIAFCTGFGLYGIVCLVGVTSMESAPAHVSGTSHAVQAMGSNVGAVLSGLPLSFIAKHYSWTGAFLVVECLSLVTVVLLLIARTMPAVIGQVKKKED